MRAQSSITPMRRGRLPACCCRHPHRVAGPERPSGRNAYPSGIIPSTITSPTGCTAGSRTEISPGARAHHSHVPNQPHAPPPAGGQVIATTNSRLTRAPTQISSSGVNSLDVAEGAGNRAPTAAQRSTSAGVPGVAAMFGWPGNAHLAAAGVDAAEAIRQGSLREARERLVLTRGGSGVVHSSVGLLLWRGSAARMSLSCGPPAGGERSRGPLPWGRPGV